ncbi:hypothetical protein Scep_029150 [Stephania cephalantha]|uniref:Uncharacterized protein n=1 Tax=Stephania cephalantha TaxID=152367 RepID=A0AAP0HD94_9MAGN
MGSSQISDLFMISCVVMGLCFHSPVLSLMDDYKRNHVPAFGNWDYADGLPITQYFESVESARQAGLFRHSYGERDLYEDDLKKTVITVVPRPRKVKSGEEKQYGYGKEQRKQGRVCDAAVPPRKQHSRAISPPSPQSPPPPPPPRRAPKAVDEDLYKISPELLYSNTNHKRKKVFGFFSCLVPSCAA